MHSVFQLMFSLENLPSYINLIVIKHYNLESKIQSLLPTQGIILACVAFAVVQQNFNKRTLYLKHKNTQACSTITNCSAL